MDYGFLRGKAGVTHPRVLSPGHEHWYAVLMAVFSVPSPSPALRAEGSSWDAGATAPFDAPSKALKEAKAAIMRVLGGKLPSFPAALGLSGKSKQSHQALGLRFLVN